MPHISNDSTLRHEQYNDKYDQIVQVRDSIKGQAHIRKCHLRETYLPRTSGMIQRGTAADAQYLAYKNRARFPNITQDVENGIIGLAFSKDAVVEGIEGKVTRNGRTVLELAMSQLRDVLETGRGILVVDAPSSGGTPYIVEYKAECLIDWAVSDEDDSKLTMCLFEEETFADDDPYKKTAIKQYRQYELDGSTVTVQVLDKDMNQIGEPVELPVDRMPVFTIGSVNNDPDWDPIPLLPVSDCALAIYRTSADHKQFIHTYGQGTPWASGVSSEQIQSIIESGLGVGAFLSSESPDARFGMLESSASTDSIFVNDIQRENDIAERYSVAITQNGNGVEAAESVKLRAMTRHATIYTVLNSVSAGVLEAIQFMNEWNGQGSKKVDFMLNADFTEIDASSQLITALNGAVAQRNIPRSVVQNVVREAGFTQLSNEEQDAEILDSEV